MQGVVIESADGHRMTMDEALQVIYDYSAFNPIRIVLEGEVGDIWGEAVTWEALENQQHYKIADVYAEYSVAEGLVSIAHQIQNKKE